MRRFWILVGLALAGLLAVVSTVTARERHARPDGTGRRSIRHHSATPVTSQGITKPAFTARVITARPTTVRAIIALAITAPIVAEATRGTE